MTTPKILENWSVRIVMDGVYADFILKRLYLAGLCALSLVLAVMGYAQ